MDYSYFTTAPQSYPHHVYHPPLSGGNATPQTSDFDHTSSPQYDGSYPTYDPYHFNTATFAAAHPRSPPTSINETSAAPVEHPAGNATFPVSGGVAVSGPDVIGPEEASRNRSSSEEKDPLTPAQSRRKAQNRAAQRAFRERKERHVKDLEHKLTTLQQTSSSLSGENERLRRELAKTKTERDALKATNGSGNAAATLASTQSYSEEPTTTTPIHFSPTEFYTSVFDPANGKITAAKRSPNHRVATSENGERLLNAGATWDMIQASDMFKRGLVDVGDVCERLKHMAKCDGQGPVFEEADVKGAIEESVAGGTDELIC